MIGKVLEKHCLKTVKP